MSGSKGRREFAKPQQSLDIEHTFRTALALHQQGQLAQAESLYRTILNRAPNHFDALHFLGVIAYQQKHYEAAATLIGRALQLNPKSASAHSNVGLALRNLDRHEDALASYDRALAIEPNHAEALSNRGLALRSLNRHDEALASFERALAIKPRAAEVLNNRGLALRDLDRHAEALDSFERALAIKPDHAEAQYNRGNTLIGLKRLEEALASFERALAIRPDYVDALSNRGNALVELQRLEEALASFDRALAIKPDYADALNNRGVALFGLKRHEDAVASYGRALAINPDYAEALNNCGNALFDLERYKEAAHAFRRVLSLKPDYDYAKSNLLRAQLRCCDWTDYERNLEAMTNDVAAGRRAATPFSFLSVSESPSNQLQCAQIINNDKYPASARALWQGERYAHDRIRVAYLSADFRTHPVAYLMAGLFETHDKARFETTAISFGPDSKDELRARLEKSFDRFVDVRGKSDRETALLLKELEIDIAVDLMGYTQDSRTRIFALRPAPVQVNYLGYPGTMGADYIDYIIADRIVIPEDQRSFYTEKVAYLPDTFQPNDSKRPIGMDTPTRVEAGLPETGFVFCAFNNIYKIMPPVFDVWMRLLQQVEGSVLWLRQDHATAVSNLRREAEIRGVAPDRLIMASRTKRLEDHLARHRLAGLFLDTLPYNAHTTASDALWAGLPVVTCLGRSFAGRVAASVLNAVGLPELVTGNLEDYEALALKLARDETMLAAITAKLARNRATFPLFDTDRYRRHIECAYETMWARYQRGEPPASFAVAPMEPGLQP